MPGVLTAAQLSFLQAKVVGTLDLTASTTRNTGSGVDQYGNPAENWTAVLTSVACGMNETTPAPIVLYPQGFLGSERRFKFSFTFGSDVKRNDRITTGGRTYRVQEDVSHDSYSLVAQVIAVQINEGFN